MKMNKCLTFFAVFALAMWAKAETIDSIYEIRSWNLNSDSIAANPYSSPDSPIGGPGVGDPDSEFAFVVRLFNAKWDDVDPLIPLENTEPWTFKYVGLSSEETAKALFPPKLGIVVGGYTRYAELDRWPRTISDAPGLTEMVFKYTARPGELALPVRLACDGLGHAVGTDDTKPELYLWGDWALTNASGDSARLVFYKREDWKRPGGMKQPEGEDALTTNTDLSESGFYIKNIDFKDHNDSSRWYEANKAWRGIHKNSTESEPFAAEIVATGVPESGYPIVYVWSEDEDLITLEGAEGAEKVDMADPANPSKTITRWVYACKFASPSAQAIPAYAKVDSGTTTLYLSPTKGFQTFGSGKVDPNGYLTVPVVCIKEQAPNVTIDASREAVVVPTASDTNFKPVAEINVKVAPGYDGGKLTLTVTPEISGVEGLDKLGKYVRISDSDGVGAWSSAGASWTKEYSDAATIFAGFTQKLYIYALGADNKTAEGNFESQGVIFKPSVDSTAESHFSGGYRNAQVYFNFESPKLTAPAEKNAVGGTDVPFDLTVADNYKNITDSTGYQIYYQKDGDPDADLDSDSWTNLGGRWGVDLSTRKLVKIGKDGELTKDRPSLKYAAGDYKTSFYLRAPNDESIRSLPVSTNVHITEPAQISAQISLDNITFSDTGTYEEGKELYVKFTLSRPYHDDEGKSCYAFLEPLDEATSNSVTGAMIIGKRGSDDEGVEVESGKPESIIDPIYRFTLLDGATPSTRLNFKVVLCKPDANRKGTYDKDRIIGEYKSNNLRFYSTNVIPTVKKVFMGSSYVDSNLDTMHDQKLNPVSVPKGVEKVFTFNINEPSNVDRTAKDDPAVKEKDDKKIFILRYSIVEGKAGKETESGAFVYGNPNDSAKFQIKHKFTIAGDALVKVQVADKDMRDAAGNVPWTDEEAIVPFYFYVKVASQPYISIVDAAEEQTIDGREFLETDLGFKLRLKLSEVQDVALPVEVRVTPLGTGTKPGKLEFAGLTWKSKEEKTDIYTGTIAAQGDEESPMDGRLQFTFKDLDGTSESRQNGFKIEAKVVDDPNKTEEENKNSDDKKWSDYYASAEATVYINNVAPVIVISPASLGAYTSATNAAPKAPTSITWNVTQEAADDLSTGLEYTWSVNGEVQSEKSAKVTSKDTQTFTPKYNTPGVVDIVLTVKDKDDETVDGVRNGYYEQTWYVTVAATKSLTTIAHGPSSGIATSSLSQYYNSAKGLGKGYVWADGSLDEASSFTLKWNMGSKELANIVAVGYKKGHESQKDDTKYEIALNENGSEKGKSGTAYRYPDDKDSYFYGWLKVSKSDSGVESAIYGGLAPEIAGEKITPSPVYLPTEKGQDDLGYEATTMEAIFSKEYREADNCGDINQDGIPDRSVVEYGFGIAEKNKVTGDDLMDVSAYNADEDLLPKGSSGGNSLVPNAPSGWDQNLPFHALLEIRGFGIGLNARYPNADTDKTIPVRDFTIYEEMAFRTYYNATEAKDDDSLKVPVATEDKKALAGLDEDQTKRLDAFWQTTTWTPENPTNPMVADTDNDGMEDGYEYWFWYGATVGYPDGEGAWKGLMEGRRLDEGDIDSFKPIPPVDIANAFNPTVPGVAEGNAATMGTLATRDFDGDGLTDFEEYVIGTNPVDFDTDGDGMMDGWEVLRGLNPCSNKEIDPNQGPLNPDGDVMAYTDLKTELHPGLKREEQPTITLTIEREVITQVFNPETLGYDEVSRTVVYFYVVLDEDFVDAKVDYEVARYQIEYDRRILPLITDPEERAAIEREIAELEKIPNPNTFKGLELCHFDKPEEGYDLDYILSNFFHSIGGELVAKNPRTYGVQELSEEDLENMVYMEDVQANTGHAFALLHNQLYNVFGFNPQTGWGGGTYERPYNTLYEYQLFKYRQKVLGGLLAASPDTVLNRFSINTTNPSLPYEITYGDKESANTSDNHGADSDADGMPDGWELYVGLNPSNAQDGTVPPADMDGDKLTQPQEFAGTTSTLFYEGCESIMAHFDSVWPNKFFPTDPFDSDTDGDGISDWQEGNEWWDYFHDGRFVTEGRMTLTFNYDDTIDRTKGFAQTETCYRGGGLNPNSIDTDKDGLPDFWEMQFAGLVVTPEGVTAGFGVSSFYSDKLRAADGTLDGIHGIQEPVTDKQNSRYGNGHFIIGGMDGTFYNDYCTDMDAADRVDYRTGTWRDFDFDGDGLQNYQEYMVQAIRSFRYDDGETPLNGRVAQWKDMGAMPLIVEAGEEEEESSVVTVSERVEEYDYPAFDYYSATNYFAVVFTNSVAMSNLYYAVDEGGVKVNAIDPKEWNWARLGYFDDTPHEWDPMAGRKYMLPPEVRLNAANSYPMHSASGKFILGGYVSTDPRQWDSDNDGMDDYWELYHGMSPIYGRDQNGDGRDIIENMLGITAKENAWTEFGNRKFEYDFDRYPWLAGAPDADPDNDKIRNFEEAIMGNMTSPTASHTDPTPLWMTEPSVPLSITRQSYVYNENLLWAVPAWSIDNAREYLYTFEGNEGYDTDNDWTADSRELTAGIIAETDPLVTSDPYRRAAIYLGGEDNKGVAYQRTGSYINTFSEKLNSDAAYDMFRQFTVECWVKPEAEGTILERGAVYAPATAGAEQGAEQWRANFRLELKEGKFVGSFDDSAAVPSGTPGSGCIVASRESAKLGEWTHLALSYNGKELRLYVNGEQQAYALCSLIPANGIIPILQDPTWGTDYPNAIFAVAPGSLVIGARHVKYPLTFHPEDESEVEYPTTIEDALTDFFKGYVAEVRIWDGARSETQLRDDREKAYTLKDVEDNRAEVFAAWSNDAKRNDNANVMGTAAIPPQLMMHYDFTSLPGATKEEDVALVPGGFDPLATFAEDNVVEPALLTPSWWLNQSTVYTDATVLPWIENSVAHLTAMDGSFADSVYWADTRASYVPSNAAGYDSFKIPNSANPYGWTTDELENDNRRFKLIRYEEMHPEYEGLYLKWKFASRSRMVGVTDLLPLGGAFAKRESDYWDGQGAMTAWTLTGVDTDGDGVPDWYEGDPADYMRELVAGLLPDGTTDSAFRDLADFNGNGLPDWWEQIYGIAGQNGHTDSDKDGLSNYVEYLLNEVYTIPEKAFDPINPKTNGYVPDAYVKLGKLYIADVFTDHDHIDDTWEVGFGNLAAISPYVYDANKDADGDGWTNYAEFQADTDPTRNASLAIDGIEMAQYPVPIVEAAITYLGEQNVNCPIVVQAWNCADEKSRTFQSIPDAKWTIGETNTDDNKQDTSNTNGMAKTKFVGMNPAREVMTHLSPGSVVAGSFKLECKDPGWVAVDILTGQGYTYGADSATWEESAHDKMRNDGSGKGDIILGQNDAVVGEIDYSTGAVTLDFTALPEYMIFSYNLANPTDASRWSIYTYANSYMRFSWSSKPVTAGKTSVYYLGDADPRSADNNSVGHLKEGKNNFIVFADTIDANGKYDPGEPFGIAYNVDVGWNYGKLAIELTDTNPIFARYQLTTGLTDRETAYGDTYDVIKGTGVDAPTTKKRVRVFRYGSAFIKNGTLASIDYLTTNPSPNRTTMMRVLMDKELDLRESGRDYVHEGDLVDIDNGIFDADWQYLVADHGDNDVVSVTYAVMIGDESLETLTSTNSVVLSRLINRRFDDKSHRMIPSPVSPAPKYETVVADACPTFKWWFGGTNTSYTAFKINLTSTDNKFSWTSDIQLMPPKSADGYYTWKLPFCVGAITPDGKVFANNAKYTWKVSAYNAKFKTDSYSAPATFYMNVPTDQIDYGSIDVAVRYFGASDVLKYKNNKIRVQAFATPDFSGTPSAEGYVLGSNVSLADTDAVTERNAELIGLPAGNYYVMAYIDTNNNGKRDDWESWGYTCVRDQRDGVIYTPKSVKVGPKVGSRDLITIYLDDCDIDQDALPDAWEWAKSGNLTTNGATVLDQHTAGSYVSVTNLVGTLDDTTKKSPVARGLASLMSFSLGNPMMAPLVIGVDPSAVNVTANGTIEVDGGVDADTFRITGIKVENGNVILEVNAKGEEPSTDASSFYDYVVKANSTVKVAVYHTSSMAEKFTLLDTLDVTITSDGGDIVIPIESGASGELFYAEIVE